MSIKEHLIELEKLLLTFEVRHSEELLKDLIAPDFKEIGASGAYTNLDDALRDLPQTDDWSAKVQDFEFRELGEGVCQLIFRAYIKHYLQDEGTYSHRTSIWKKFESGWKVIYHQGTRVPKFDLNHSE